MYGPTDDLTERLDTSTRWPGDERADETFHLLLTGDRVLMNTGKCSFTHHMLPFISVSLLNSV